jgi:hypothetical protein
MAKQGGGSYPPPCSVLAQPAVRCLQAIIPGIRQTSFAPALSLIARPQNDFQCAAFRATIGNRMNLRRRELNGSSEFTTWVALAGAAILAGLTAIFSSSPFLLIAAALIGAYLGYKGEQLGRAYVERRLGQNRSK